ncbi:MAG: hypothetical protein ACI9C4_001410 [Paraglaciecola sp.]
MHILAIASGKKLFFILVKHKEITLLAIYLTIALRLNTVFALIVKIFSYLASSLWQA